MLGCYFFHRLLTHLRHPEHRVPIGLPKFGRRPPPRRASGTRPPPAQLSYVLIGSEVDVVGEVRKRPHSPEACLLRTRCQRVFPHFR